MPLYEYFCRECGSHFDVMRTMAQIAVEPRCPKGHDGVKKVLSIFATVSNGDNGYVAERDENGCGRCGAPEPGSCAMN